MKGVHELVPKRSEFPPIHCPFCKKPLVFEDLVSGEDWGSGQYNGRLIFWLDWEVACPECNEEFDIGLQAAPTTIEVHYYDKEEDDSMYIDYDIPSGTMEVQ